MPVSSYILPQEVQDRLRAGGRDRLAELLNLADGEDPLASPVLSRAISAASSTIDLYLRGRYELPVVSQDAALTDIAFYLTRFALMSGRPELDQPGSVQRQDRDEAMKTLRAIQRGEIILEFPPVNRTESLAPVTQVVSGKGASANGQTEFERTLEAY